MKTKIGNVNELRMEFVDLAQKNYSDTQKQKKAESRSDRIATSATFVLAFAVCILIVSLVTFAMNVVILIA